MSHFFFPVLYSKTLCHVRMGLNGVAFLGLTKRKAGLEVFRRTAKVFQTHRRIRWETVALQTVMYCNTNRFQTKSKGAGKSRVYSHRAVYGRTNMQSASEMVQVHPASQKSMVQFYVLPCLPPSPRAYPAPGIWNFFLTWRSIPHSRGTQKETITPPLGGAPREPQIQQYWFLYNRKPRSFVQNVKAQEFYEQKTVPVFKKIKKACTVLLSS